MPRKGYLNELEIAALFALYVMSRGASTAHFPAAAIGGKFRSDFKGQVLEGLEELARDSHGFIFRKPTAGGLTYGITGEGLKKLRDLKLI